MADGEVHRHLVEHDLGQVLLLFVSPRRQLPFRDVRVDEQRSIGVALAVELRVQRPEPDRHFAFHDRSRTSGSARRGSRLRSPCSRSPPAIFSKLNTVVDGWSLPPATIHLPSDPHRCRAAICRSAGSTATPGTFAGSSTGTPSIIVALPSATACAAAFQFTTRRGRDPSARRSPRGLAAPSRCCSRSRRPSRCSGPLPVEARSEVKRRHQDLPAPRSSRRSADRP